MMLNLRQQKLSSPYRLCLSKDYVSYLSTIVEIIKSLQTWLDFNTTCRKSTIVEIIKSLQTVMIFIKKLENLRQQKLSSPYRQISFGHWAWAIYDSRNYQVLIDTTFRSIHCNYNLRQQKLSSPYRLTRQRSMTH